MSLYLVNPSEKGILKDAGDRIPYGLLSIATGLGNTKVYDLNHDSEEKLMQDFKREKPDNVGISVYTSPCYNEAVKLADKFKGRTRLIAGGYHASSMPETLPMFDTIIRGPAINFSKTKNVDFSLINLDNYGINYDGKKYGTLISSVGCPFNCVFCFNMTKKVQYKDTHFLKKEIDDFKKAGFEGIYFLDDVFTLNKKRMTEVVEYMSKNNLSSRVTTRADLVDEGKLEIMAKNGVEWLSIGIESGDNQILKKANKGMTIEQNYDVVKLANGYGIKTKGFFIIGLPSESERTAKKTINFSLELKNVGLKQADFYGLMPFPGTPIWNNPEKFGIKIIDKDYTKYLQAGRENIKVFHKTKKLSSERIEELLIEAKEEWRTN